MWAWVPNDNLSRILVFSISEMSSGKSLMAAILYAILLNFKHLFLYVAPVYFIFLLKTYCFSSSPSVTAPSRDFIPQGILLIGCKQWIDTRLFSFKKFTILGSSVALIFAISLGPFIALGQIGQVLSRLFPFGRFF